MTGRRSSVETAYNQDPIGREQLILQYLPLVHHVIGRLAIGMPGVLDREDLVAHGIVGLIQAIDRFDSSRGVPFAAWVQIRIRGAVLDAVRALDLLNPIIRQRVRTLQTVASNLTATLGRFPTDDELRDTLGLSHAEYAAVTEAAGCSVISLDESAKDEESPLADLLATTRTDDPSERGALLAMLGEALRKLDERERLVLSLYYVEDLTLQEVAAVLKMHKTAIVRIHSRAITKLRTFLEIDEAKPELVVGEVGG